MNAETTFGSGICNCTGNPIHKHIKSDSPCCKRLRIKENLSMPYVL